MAWLTMFFFRAIAVAIGENLFSGSLRKKLVDLNVPIPADEVISVGPTGIRSLTTVESVIQQIQQAYCFAFDMTMYFALAALIVAIPCAVGMQWLNARAAKNQDESQDMQETKEGSIQKI